MTFPTAADAAELDVMVHALVFDYFEHRERCDACQPCAESDLWDAHKDDCAACKGDAPLTYGPPCERRRQHLNHTAECTRCVPCPSLQRAIALVVDWRDARELLSTAEALRALERVA